MRALPLLVAAILSLSYGLITQAAIAADLDPAVVGRARAVADPSRVWFGGTLAPVTVEAPAGPASALPRPTEAPPPLQRPAVPPAPPGGSVGRLVLMDGATAGPSPTRVGGAYVG